MKKLISMLLVLSMLLSSTLVFADGIEDTLKDLVEGAENVVKDAIDITGAFLESIIEDVVAKFKDFEAGKWYSEVMAKLNVLGGINGYPDGTVKPNGTVTKGEFTKMLLGTLGYIEENSKSGHWADNWVSKAIELDIINYILDDEFTSDKLNEDINREEMAIMVSRATNEYFDRDKLENYELNIRDLYKIVYKTEVLRAYALGLIGGYPDGEFKPENNLTRAEASAVVIRLVDEKMRLVNEPQGKAEYSNNPEVQYINDLARRYPENSMIYKEYSWQYNAKQKPGLNDNIVLLVIKKPGLMYKESDYSIILFDNYTDKDKEVLKEVLKDLYPTNYEKVYKQAIKMFDKSADASDITDRLDDRNILYRRDDGSIHLIIGLKGVQ